MECCSPLLLLPCRKSWENNRFSETKGSTLNMSSDSMKYKLLVLTVKHGSVILGAPCDKGHCFLIRGHHLCMRIKIFKSVEIECSEKYKIKSTIASKAFFGIAKVSKLWNHKFHVWRHCMLLWHQLWSNSAKSTPLSLLIKHYPAKSSGTFASYSAYTVFPRSDVTLE